MKKNLLKILGLISILSIVGIMYFFQERIKIHIIQRNAISNYKNNIHTFQKIKFDKEAKYFYSISIENQDTITSFFTNSDFNYLDSLFSLDNIEASEAIERMKYININDLAIESLPSMENGKIKFENRLVEDWTLYFHGSKTDNRFLSLIENINFSSKTLNNQIEILKETNCKKLTSHKEGIELAYDEGIIMKVGCLVDRYYPIKYNFGNRFKCRKGLVTFKELDKDVQCYIRIN